MPISEMILGGVVILVAISMFIGSITIAVTAIKDKNIFFACLFIIMAIIILGVFAAMLFAATGN